MPIIENTVNGNLNVKETAFTKNLDVSGTAYFNDVEVSGSVKANGGLEVDGISMKNTGSLITWPDSGNNGNANINYPVNTGGFRWSGQGDGVLIFTQETEIGNLDLCIKFTSDDSNGLVIFNKSGKQVARIGADGKAEFASLFLDGQEVLAAVDIQDLRDQIESLENQKTQNETTIEEYKVQVATYAETIIRISGDESLEEINEELTAENAQLKTENQQLQQRINELEGNS